MDFFSLCAAAEYSNHVITNVHERVSYANDYMLAQYYERKNVGAPNMFLTKNVNTLLLFQWQKFHPFQSIRC